ncbi:MAG: hypothetical protein A4E23_01641 [Methanomethylovorans sp. PtaU1.Bin073]|nr:MAG: hypothetical protein A4E23_01641 [Methanomethylovorans sp. PtaU1.Bin073]
MTVTNEIPQYAMIPTELKEVDQWVMWKLEPKPGQDKPAKILYTINNTRADSTDPTTWNGFQSCINALESGKFSGIGFVFTAKDPYVGVDWDGVRDPETGEIDPEVLHEIRSLDSYAEISQSGKGAHVICKGKKPGNRCRSGCREMYTEGRFFVMTGNHIQGTPTTINEAPIEAIQAIYDKIAKQDTVKSAPQKSPQMMDSEIIALCMGVKNADKFEALWDGDTSAYAGDDSSADLALCDILAFFTQDPIQIDRLFRRSGLYRDKWDRVDYRDKTIEAAISGLTDTYQPKNGSCRETTPNENTEEDIETLTFDEIRNLKEEQLDIRLNMDLPEDHFLTVFRKWQESRTDAYPEYHFMGGLWLLSAFCQGKVVLKLTTGHVKPNIWVTILGLTTISHKTTSINNTKYIFETVTETRAYNNIYSQEGYLETLQDNPVSHFIYDEVAGLLAKMHAKYNDGIFDLDCALYSGSSIQKTLASKKGQPHTVTVDNPYVTKLYATTPDKFTTNIQQVDFDCGWGFRFLYCWPKYKKGRRGLATETQEDVDARGAVITRALKIYQMIEQYKELPFTVEPGALEYLDAIVEQHENIAWNTDNDAYAAATGRGQENTLKIAMLLEIGKSKPSFCITLDTMKYAADLVFNYFVPTTLDVCDRIQEDIRNNQIEKIISKLRKKGGVGYHSDVLRETKLVAKVFNECIYTMVESGAIKVYKEKETGKKTYVLLGGGDSEKHNSHNSQNSQILQLPHVEKSNGNFVNLITSDTIRTPTEYFGFLCESVNCENFENSENSNGTKTVQSICEDNKPEEQCSEISPNVENYENVNADLIESCLDQWEKFGGPIFSKNAHKAKLDILKFHKMHGINPQLIYDAVDRRAEGRCVDCGDPKIYGTSEDGTQRCKECYNRYFMRPSVVIPEEISLEEPAGVTT